MRIGAAHDLERAAGHVNGRFAAFGWVPVQYLNKSFRWRTMMAVLRVNGVANLRERFLTALEAP